MARISLKHPGYRTKDEIAKDVAFILKTRRLTHGTKHAVLRQATWVWTEFHGKYNGCPYWSKAAIDLRRRKRRAKFVHEHAVPKKVVIDLLFKLKNPTPASVRRRLARYLKGVVITLKEDARLRTYTKSMPKEFYTKNSPHYRNPWLRYKKCGIKVIHRKAAGDKT